MTRHRPKRMCRTDGCTVRTASSSGRCGQHRRPAPVHLDPTGQVNIGGYLSMSPAAALDLADRIVDTIEAGRMNGHPAAEHDPTATPDSVRDNMIRPTWSAEPAPPAVGDTTTSPPGRHRGDRLTPDPNDRAAPDPTR